MVFKVVKAFILPLGGCLIIISRISYGWVSAFFVIPRYWKQGWVNDTS